MHENDEKSQWEKCPKEEKNHSGYIKDIVLIRTVFLYVCAIQLSLWTHDDDDDSNEVNNDKKNMVLLLFSI